MAGEYDNAFRRIMQRRPREIWSWLSGEPPSAFAGLEPVQAELAGRPARIDSLSVEAAADGNVSRILQLEIEHRARPRDIGRRLLRDVDRIEEAYRCPPEQHVMVLTDFAGQLPGRYELGGVIVAYQPHHLWLLDPAPLLDDPWTATLAVLAAGSHDTRIEVLDAAFQRIGAVPETQLRYELAQHATTFAGAYLDRSMLELFLRRITTMALDYRDFPLFQDLIAEGEKRGLEEGEKRGLEEGERRGEEHGRAEIVLALLRHRFHPLPGDVETAVSGLDAAEVTAFGVALLDLDTLDGVRAWLADRPAP